MADQKHIPKNAIERHISQTLARSNANAALRGAAAKLLAALKEAYPAGGPAHDNDCFKLRGVPHECTCKTGRARAAIAEAEGT